jgi:RNA polymerase sigma factor (sigma-70 family)
MATVQPATLLRHIRKMAADCGAPQRTDRQLLDDFAARRSEAAFAALLSRHGPMVLRVCRRVLHHEQDAEDAFQATFLVLARNTASIRKHEALAPWLHGVAFRTAMTARRSAARRRSHEAKAGAAVPLAAVSPTWDDVQAVLDEEVRRLPSHLREAFVMCVLEGKGGPDVAAELKCKEGTVKSRVHRARECLRQQLGQRGIQLSALLAVLSVAEGAGRSAVPAALARSAVGLGLLVAAGELAAVIPSHVAALAAGATGAMFVTRARIAAALLLAVGLIAAGAGALAHQALAADKQPSQSQRSAVGNPKAESAAPKPPAPDEQADLIEVSGRVVDPDGKAFAGAKVFFTRSVFVSRDAPPPPPTATSDAEGRFRLRVSRTGYQTDHEKADWQRGAVVAVGRDFAPGWVGGDNVEKLADVTIKLTRSVPIEGRAIDLQGKPVMGVSVRVLSFKFREGGGDLRAFAEELRSPEYASGQFLPGFAGTTMDPALLALAPPAVTGADGKFRVAGISAECQVGLHFEGPTIETVEAYALTRAMPTVGLPNVVFHGATFDHAAAPTRPVVGVIRDKDTGKPLADVAVRARIPKTVGFSDRYIRTATGADGSYRLVGLSRNGGHRLEVLPAPRQPYLPAIRALGATAGLDPLTADFALKRGVLIRGRVTDKGTGRPVPAVVAYFAFVNNPYLKEAPEFRGHEVRGSVHVAEDGSFRLVGLPGRGLLVAQAAGRLEEQYVMASGTDEIKGPRFDSEHFDTEPSVIDPHRFNVLAEVNPDKDAESIVRDVILDPGKTAVGTIVDPDGKPVKGVSIEPVRGIGFRVGALPSAEFRVPAIDPKRPRWFFFRHRDKNLAAAVLLKGDESAPSTVRLQKCATIAGRVVDDDGLPCSAWILDGIEGGQLDVHDYFAVGGSPMHGTGKSGRFRIEGVMPGLKVAVYAGKNTSYFDPLATGLILKPGEVKDLGDVKAKPSQ